MKPCKTIFLRAFINPQHHMKSIFLLIIVFNLPLSGFAFAPRNERAVKATRTIAANARPKIISRKKWKAKDPVGKVSEHRIRYITIHHTGTLQNEKLPIEKKMQNLQSFSQREDRLASGKVKPAWFDVPYHYYIAADGKIAEGREIKFVGDTNTEYDPTGHALVVLEGNFETESPSVKQLESLQELVSWLSSNWKVSASEIKAHNDYAKTACPGQNLKKLLPALQLKIGDKKK
jgi:N-acetyl-anhydromuramyl-L-alanine amidase AmpD